MYEILRRGHSKLTSISSGSHTLNFKDKIAHTPDKRLAEDLQQKYPHEIINIPVDNMPTDEDKYRPGMRPQNGRPTHNYIWATPIGNWHDRIDWRDNGTKP